MSLLVDDDPEDTERYRRFLLSDRARTYTLRQTADVQRATTLLGREQFDCILLDQHLSKRFMLDRLESLTHHAGIEDVPVIVVAGHGKEIAAESMRRGAAEYIPRGRLSAATCGQAIGNAIEKATLRRTIKEQTQNLRVVKNTVQTQNTDISNFYHTVAHEIKTPLTAAREFVTLVLDGVAGEVNTEQRELLSHALDSCDDLAYIFNDLIESARFETGKVTLRMGLASLETVVRRCVVAAAPSLGAKQLQLDERSEPHLPDIEMDSTRMVQVVSNLLSNAIKFTAPGGQVSIFSRRSATHRDSVEVGITDTGCGIPKAEQARIFDRLYQVKPDGDELLGSGLGLGLSVAKDIVELHGGTIEVDARVGAGSTFVVRLPVVQDIEGDR